MPRDILFPTHLDALVVAPGTTSPVADLERKQPVPPGSNAPAADALFVDGPPLEPGIHLHWSLPDPLTQGSAPSATSQELELPAVPDRWLLIRIAPARGPEARATRAWVVDAATRRTTPLDGWHPAPPTRPTSAAGIGLGALVAAAAATRLTTLGPLPRARIGVDDLRGEARAHATVYYPMARDRFGFHDTRAALEADGIGAGPVSYLVIGWYADASHDPMNVTAAAQASWLAARRVSIDDAGEAVATVTPTVVSGASVGAGIGGAGGDATVGGRGVGGVLGALAAAFERAGVGALVRPVPTGVVKPTGDRLICHGAITGVTWNQPPPARAPAPFAQARLYGSLHEAAERYLADVSEEAWMQGALSVLLGRSTGHSASYLDAAWKGHQAGFVSRLGESADAARFHAPDAPALIVDGVPRSLRHGEDADLDPERKDGRPGRVRARTADHVVTALRATVAAPTQSGGTVTLEVTVDGAGLAQPVATVPAVPAVTAALLAETMLLDRGNLELFRTRVVAPVMLDDAWRRTAAVELVDAWDRMRKPTTAADRQRFVGLPPTWYAVRHWAPAPLPLYVEVEGAIAPAPASATGLPAGWTLGAIDLEPTPTTATPTAAATATVPPASVPFGLRRLLTPMVARMLATATGSEEARALNLLACALPEVERALADRAARAGRVTIARLRVIDTFGGSRVIDPPAALDLTPRLAGWARISARLLWRASAQTEADDQRPPVCGFVLVDRVDHALEVFDAHGARVGQLRDRRDGATAAVVWESDPFRAPIPRTGLSHRLTPADPAWVLGDADPDAVLLALVRGLMTSQRTDGVVGGDTSVSALVRALDALQPTAARTGDGDDVGPLLGRPLAVVRLAARLQRAALPTPSATDAPAPEPGFVGGVDAAVTVPLALGAVTRTDDGVFGTFVGGDYTRFHPVDAAAIAPSGAGAPPPITHPYAAAAPPVIPLAAGATALLTLLVDPRLAIHVRTGVLPAKRIGLPTAMYQPALRDLAPSVRVGPVLMPPATPWLPAPYIAGGDWRWLQVKPPAPGQAAGPPVDQPLTTPGAGAGLAEEAPVVREGWLRLVPRRPA